MHKLFNVDQITNKQNVSSTVAWLAVISEGQRVDVPYKQAIGLKNSLHNTSLATKSFVYRLVLTECGDLTRPSFHLCFLLSEMTVMQVTPASSCVIDVLFSYFATLTWRVQIRKVEP